MSTDTTNQPDPTIVTPEGAHPADTSTAGAPSRPKRNTALLVAAMAAVVVAAIAIAGLILWRGGIDDANAETEAAFARSVSEQGAQVTTVECAGDTCAAIIGGQAYTVLVQEDEQGEQHFGVVAYTGD